MTMIEMNSVDAVPGEAELLSVAVNYVAARLFTLRQRKTLSVMIDITSQQVRVPVTRAMLGPQRAGLGTKAPTMFEMTVSTAAGIRDAAETIAHELIHISQAVNGRLSIMSKRKKINGRKMAVDVVRWMGGKPVMMENLAWHLRPWEIEACHWQAQLVDEFFALATGMGADQPVQSGKRKQLALYPVRAPLIVAAQPEPDFHHPATEVELERQDAAERIASNGDSIDRVIAGAMPAESDPAPQGAPEAVGTATESELVAAAEEVLAGDEVPENELPENVVPEIEVPENEAPRYEAPEQDMTVSSQDDSAPVPDLNENVPEASAVPAGIVSPALPAALPDTPVYKRPVIEVDVPGLDAPRALEREAMMKKLDELRQRGLAGSDSETETK